MIKVRSFRGNASRESWEVKCEGPCKFEPVIFEDNSDMRAYVKKHIRKQHRDQDKFTGPVHEHPFVKWEGK